MSVLTLAREGNVWVLTLCAGENRFNDAVLDEWRAALDRIEQESGDHAALVITSSDPKFFSNGIDLQAYIGRERELMSSFVPRLDAFLKRMALLPLPVVMAINGHAYAGGALLAAAGDFRLMRADRGRLCFPEVDIKLPFTLLMTELVRLLPNAGAGWELAATGAAWGGEEAARRGVIDRAVSADELLPQAMALATALAGKHRPTYATIKQRWRHAVVEARLAD